MRRLSARQERSGVSSEDWVTIWLATIIFGVPVALLLIVVLVDVLSGSCS